MTASCTADQLSTTLKWQMAICYLAFTVTYLMCNTAPYGPFMAVKLLPGRATPDNVGKYSSFFMACFIWGRSSGAGYWGQMADTRGRLPVMYISLALGGIFTLLFGLSNNYFLALAMRFCTGLFCDASSILKTCVTEMAGDDRELEAYSMNLAVNAWAMGTLLAPAIGGAMADPLKQYPHLMEDGMAKEFLLRFPFFLPNLVGALLCFLGIPFTRLYLRETLPAKQEAGVMEKQEEETPDHDTASELQSLLPAATNTLTSGHSTAGFEESFVICPEVVQLAYERDVQDIMLDSYRFSDDLDGVITSKEFRHSMAVSIYQGSPLAHRPSRDKLQAISESTQRKRKDVKEEQEVPLGSPTMLTLLKNRDTRNHLIVYCIGLFLISFHMEAFPLFCLSQNAGLGVSEATIGGIMLASGAVHAVLQPGIYNCIFATSGLKGSIRWAATFFIPVFFIIPFSLLSKGVGTDHLRWTAMVFLGVVIGLGRIFTVTFVSSISVSLNHLVSAQYRATFNGLLVRISGGCKGAAPIMAGFFTAWAFTSGIIPSHGGGAVLLYGGTGLIAIVLAAASHLLIGPDEHF